MRTAVLVKEGTFEGPLLKGRAVPGSGGDYAYGATTRSPVSMRAICWRRRTAPSSCCRTGVSCGAASPTRWRACAHGRSRAAIRCRMKTITCAARPASNAPKGKHDWLTKHVFIGVGERKSDGNRLRYYAVT